MSKKLSSTDAYQDSNVSENIVEEESLIFRRPSSNGQKSPGLAV